MKKFYLCDKKLPCRSSQFCGGDECNYTSNPQHALYGIYGEFCASDSGLWQVGPEGISDSLKKDIAAQLEIDEELVGKRLAEIHR